MFHFTSGTIYFTSTRYWIEGMNFGIEGPVADNHAAWERHAVPHNRILYHVITRNHTYNLCTSRNFEQSKSACAGGIMNVDVHIRCMAGNLDCLPC